ncbi:MAG: HAMP domain-containing histidine kinase [Clostridiales bacterium]|nr:HAMP domain-containing histidine kinase [Clostridiales bacterium]
MRVNIIVALFLIGTIPLFFLAREMVDTYNENARTQRISELQSQGAFLSNLIMTSGYIDDTGIESVNQEIQRDSSFYQARILVLNQDMKILKDTYGLEDDKTLISKEVINALKGNSSINTEKNKEYIEIVLPITDSTTKETHGVLIMNFSIKSINTLSAVLVKRATTMIVTLTVILAVVAFMISGSFMKPLNKLVRTINNLQEGYMDEEVSVEGHNEIREVQKALNQMLNKIKTLESSRQEFVSNVSHELKTPLTSVKVLADSLLAQEDAPAELYREFLVDITEEIDRENKIINDLLTLVKLDKSSSDISITSVNINDLLESVLKRLRPIAKMRNIELVYESYRVVMVEVDEVKLSLALTNLIENAIKYNVEDGWVRVSLNADHKYFYIKVADSGIGIPEEEQNSIFERFYRVDKARSRGTGGTGLGLSITKNIVLMHKGAIKVYSKEGEGTTFTVRIPINYIE